MSRLEDEEGGLFTNRTTMLANLEEWIKMATDNKINSRNSWNFALIDYFYDLNILKDSENNINFQKASATLDGCVKIYSSRVDSVTSETGKLLSGLSQRKNEQANSKNNKQPGDGNDGDDDDADSSVQIDALTGLPVGKDSDEYLKRRRVHNRVLETTLVEFDNIRMKELDQELNIDPLFKKALVDFDEGGAKSLLLNTLSIDESGRVVFDAAMKNEPSLLKEKESNEEPLNENNLPLDSSKSMDEDNSHGDRSDKNSTPTPQTPITEPEEEEDSKADITLNKSFSSNFQYSMDDEILALGIDYIKFDDISTSDISPSLQNLRNVIADINKAKGFIDSINNKFDNFLTEDEIKEAVPEEEGPNGNDYDDGINQELEYSMGNNEDVLPFDINDGGDNFGEDNEGGIDDEEGDENGGLDSMLGSILEKDLMAYFDEKMNRNWRGREHWKVANYKKANTIDNKSSEPNNEIEREATESEGTSEENKKSDTKKERKKQIQIDFLNLDPNIESIVFDSKKRSGIDMAIKSRTNDSHYLLPDDYHFSTEKITGLFIKPNTKMSIFNRVKRRKMTAAQVDATSDNLGNGIPQIADEQFWANNYEEQENENNIGGNNDLESSNIVGADIENPFEEEGIDFNQAFEDMSLDENDDAGKDIFTQKDEKEDLTKLRQPDKVTYSRVSKKVDVRRLKKNIWMSVKSVVSQLDETSDILQFRFTDITKNLGKFYSPESLSDISTSFCFICLLHLANEHGLQIKSTENYEDLTVIFDKSVVTV